MNNEVLFEKQGNIAIISINRPEKYNAVNRAVAHGLADAWHMFNKDDDLRVAVVTGCGKNFTAGVDLHEDMATAPAMLAQAIPWIGVEVHKPVIAAVNGFCLGVGFVLAMYSDIRIAADDAQFGYPEVKIGVTGGMVSALVKYMPMGPALEFMLSGERMSAGRAYELGFVNKVTPPTELLAEAIKRAVAIADNAPLVVGALKRLAYLAANPSIIETAYLGNRILAQLPDSEDLKEGVQAFREKRKPTFKGR